MLHALILPNLSWTLLGCGAGLCMAGKHTLIVDDGCALKICMLLRMQAGFCTLYSFYAYPDRVRLRVSQVLVTIRFNNPVVNSAFCCCKCRVLHRR